MIDDGRLAGAGRFARALYSGYNTSGGKKRPRTVCRAGPGTGPERRKNKNEIRFKTQTVPRNAPRVVTSGADLMAFFSRGLMRPSYEFKTKRIVRRPTSLDRVVHLLSTGRGANREGVGGLAPPKYAISPLKIFKQIFFHICLVVVFKN